MTANLTPEAYAIWEGIPMKRKGVDKGRSAWISSVIIQHAGWVERHSNLMDAKISLEKSNRLAAKTLNDCQIKRELLQDEVDLCRAEIDELDFKKGRLLE